MIPRWLRAVAGSALGAFLLWLALRQVDMVQLKQAFVGARGADLGIALILYWADIALRAVRWRALLAREVKLPFRQVLRALVVGYAVNNIVPARLGELFRADFLSREYGVTRSGALGSIVVERLLDALLVVLLFGVGLAVLPARAAGALEVAAAVAGAVVVLAAAAVAGISCLTDTGWDRRFPRIGAQVRAVANSFAIVRARGIVAPLFLSCAIWGLESGAIYAVLRSCGVAPGLLGLCVVVGAGSLSTLLPSAPGYVGSLQVAFMLAFVALGLDSIAGVAAATLVQVFLLGGMPIAGLVVLAGSSWAGRKLAKPLVKASQ